jgi:hypothetical protein
MVRGGVLLVAAFLATAHVASAQTARVGSADKMSFGDAAALLAQTCGPDIDANCRGVNLDANRLRECLSRNVDALSPQCRSGYLRAFDAIQKRIAARIAVANACGHDIVKSCNGSTRETSRSVPCLIASSNVSRSCKQALDDAGYR